MRSLWLGTAILVFGAVSALAADLPARAYSKAPAYVAPAVSWTGWYAGANIGYGWGSGTGDRIGGSAQLAGFDPDHFGTKNAGVLGGGQIGYNYQSDRFLIGLETDFQGADSRGSTFRSVPQDLLGRFGILADRTERSSQRLNWFGTLRARAGLVPVSNVLLYATGGLAYGEVESAVAFGIPAVPPLPALMFPGSVARTNSAATTETKVGWTVGAGAEWMVAPGWSVKAEYLHVDLGSTTVTVADIYAPQPFSTYRFRHQQDIVRVGFNYQFGGPVAARY